MSRRRRITERLQVNGRPTVTIEGNGTDRYIKEMTGSDGERKARVLGLYKGSFKVNCALKARDKEAERKLRTMERQLGKQLGSAIFHERVTGNDKVETTYYVYEKGTAARAEVAQFKMN